ncbi:hypothetical protein HYFRA_00012655 [Hymenoscyphus fraxineus]|uniref:Armadillo repeat-containing protein 8 n=1 Tax=Hymenoscyphus fraxineus TaxID=746836 RepID=A0A9N9L8H2_9HELO|nr:hypothetical protein HYFRA_00012655 [Hymenoscyphus fraxineus]
MARIPWSTQIRNARNTAEQVSLLRTLKNEFVGHPLKKEAAVAAGVLEPVVRLTFNKTGSRSNGKSHDQTSTPTSISQPLSEEEAVRFQGLQVLASLALGGPAFLPPLHAASVLPAILSNLCPSNNPAQLVLASLRAISNLADSSALSCNSYAINTSVIANSLFTRRNVSSLAHIISQVSASSTVHCQISLASSIIGRICREERHQQILAISGVLDALATKYAGFVVAEGLVIPGAENLAQRDGLREYIPPPTPRTVGLAVILEAIATIIANSKFRASQLLYSPSILAVLPTTQSPEFVASQSARAAWNAFNVAGLSGRQSQLNAVDYLLPYVPLHQFKSSTSQVSAFPPLGSFSSREPLVPTGRSITKFPGASIANWGDSSGIESGTAFEDLSPIDSEELESPLIPNLILTIRNKRGMERLMAASVLTVLYRAGLANKTRETYIGLLVIPLLVQMLDDSIGPTKGKDIFADEEAQNMDRAIKERAPAVLSMLITDSKYLQKAAFDAGVVGKLAKMLKVSYDPVVDLPNTHAWSPRGNDEMIYETSDADLRGYSPLLVHKIKIRESTLKAIAALVPFKDEYRKAIVEQGTIPYIVESLSSKPGKPSPKGTENGDKTSDDSADNKKQAYGINTVDVLIAACGAIRALSRSVGILRTTLIDSGVAMPVFRLLQHPDIEVQTAATATVCNLVTDVSPMRTVIAEAGVLKILCAHAHSMNAKLRLNAVWALKHFVHSVPNDDKMKCLEELGQGWLVRLICDDTEDEALSSLRGKGEMFDGVDDDIDMDIEEVMSPGFIASCRPSPPRSNRSKSIQQAELRLAALREAETNPAKRARKDDVAVQEQGLDFIRNLIGGAGQGSTSETTDMIDYLFAALGQDRVFEILASKLRPKVIHPFGRRGSNSETRVVPPQSEIIIAVGYILVHMAASIPRHRQLVIAQTDLLKLLVPQFSHESCDVRLALCWLVTNLTWMDDASDAHACAQRANELKKLGFLAKLEMLEHDPELNVRERSKSAAWQMKQKY